MWVDIFPAPRSEKDDKEKRLRIPPAVAINRRVPKSYQLRVIVWNTKVFFINYCGD